MTEWIISSSALIIIAIILRFILKGRIHPGLQAALWGLVLLRLLIPVSLFPSAVSVMNVVPVSAGATGSAPNNGTTAEALPPVFDNRENILPNQTLITADAPVAAGNGGEIIVIEKSGKPDYIKMLRVFWLCGTAVFSVWFIFTNLSFYRRIKRTRKPLDIRHPLPGYSTEALRSPCVFGFIRPAIYVTPPVAEDETTLKHVLAHETAHVKHGDNWWPLLWNLALALHWYNPLVWIASALRRLDSEIFADAGAVSAIGETGRLDYGETLIRLIISKTRPGDLISAATTMTGGKRGIAERIKMIVNKPRMAFCSLIAFLLIAAFSVSCTFTGAGANGAKKEEPPSTMPDYIQEFSEISEAFQKAEEAYAWFTGYGAIELDMSEKHFDNGIVWYGIVTREGISTISELKAYLSSLFDEATCEKLLSSSIGAQGDIPLFMERDGTLYCAAGVVGLLSYTDCERTLGIKTSDGSSATVAVSWAMSLYDVSLSGSYEISCLRGEDGGWRFTDFILPIHAAEKAYEDHIQDTLKEFDVPDAVLKAAYELAARHFAQDREAFPEYDYQDVRVESIELVYAYEDINGVPLDIYQLNYEFLSGSPENIMMAGGMYITEDNWVCPDYPDSRYLVFNRNSGEYLFAMMENDCYPGDAAFTEDLIRMLGEPTPSADKTAVWANEVDYSGFSITAENPEDALSVISAWAEAYIERYVNNTSEDNPLHSSAAVVLSAELCAKSLTSTPVRIVARIRWACDAADKKAFEKWFVGWAGPPEDKEYPQYSEWMAFGHFAVLEQQNDKSWRCIEVGSGGYGGWGYLNYDWLNRENIDTYMEDILSGDFNDNSAELVLQSLPFIDWPDFNDKWGAEGWAALLPVIGTACTGEGRVYGPEQDRMWPDVYPDDQLYRNLYVMKAAVNADGAYAEGLSEILKIQYAYDNGAFLSGLNHLSSDERLVIEKIYA